MLRRHFFRAVKDIHHNRFLNLVTMVTIALSILIFSAFYLFFFNTDGLMNAWRRNIRIMAYLGDDIAESDIPALKTDLLNRYGVREVRYISKADAMAHLKQQLGPQASLLAGLRENPLPAAFEVMLLEKDQSWERIQKLAAQIESLSQITDVEYGQQWLGRFSSVYQLFRIAGYALGGLFFMAAIFFVANTIRLVLYARRDEVEIMRLVGATDHFIKIPFYMVGLIQGAVGGMIGLLALLAIYWAIVSNMTQPLWSPVYQLQFLPLDALAMILAGSVAVGWLGCYVSLKQFIKS